MLQIRKTYLLLKIQNIALRYVMYVLQTKQHTYYKHTSLDGRL